MCVPWMKKICAIRVRFFLTVNCNAWVFISCQKALYSYKIRLFMLKKIIL